MKICAKCKRNLPNGNFYQDRVNNRLQTYCKECQKLRSRQRYQEKIINLNKGEIMDVIVERKEVPEFLINIFKDIPAEKANISLVPMGFKKCVECDDIKDITVFVKASKGYLSTCNVCKQKKIEKSMLIQKDDNIINNKLATVNTFNDKLNYIMEQMDTQHEFNNNMLKLYKDLLDKYTYLDKEIHEFVLEFKS